MNEISEIRRSALDSRRPFVIRHSSFILPLLLTGCLLFSASFSFGEDFGDISVSPNAIYTGNTFHGYAEMRIVLENHAPTKTHIVTLIYPNNSYRGYGNSIGRLSRSVSLPAGAREVVSLLQPPLPAQGDSSIRVEVDGSREGQVRAPNANNHCNYSYRGGPQMGTVLVSRSLDYDAVALIFQANGLAFTAGKAVGPPDATTSGYDPNCWMPDMRSYGRTNWLELDYATPQVVDRIEICHNQPTLGPGAIVLVGAGGANLAVIPFPSGSTTAMGPGWQTMYLVSNTNLVHSLRLEFGRVPPGSIAIDAVQISGPGSNQWASAARASSDASVSGPRVRPGSATGEEVESIRAESPVSDWSENWLAYSPFDAVIVSDADIAAMPAAVFAALGNYLEAGGNVVEIGKDELPASWRAASSKKLHDGTESEIGFGSMFTFSTENPGALETSTILHLRSIVRDNVRYFQNLPGDSAAANNLMPVVENLKIPTRGIVVIMLAFIVIIGPVNMIYLTRIKRRTWMLWTIPAISFATTLLVFAYSLLREGISPDTRIAGLTVLDQNTHQAATIGGEAFYCPLTPSGGLRFDVNTEATPLVTVDYGSGTAREVDWTQLQHFQHGWVSARVPAHFHVRKAETRRERIQVLNEGGKLQIVNSLGAPIKSLWYADADLNLYQAQNVGAGEKGGLIFTKKMPALGKTGINGILHDVGYSTQGTLAENPGAAYLRPNTYIAILGGNPFIENALGSYSSPKRTKSSAIVFGIIETDGTSTPTMTSK